MAGLVCLAVAMLVAAQPARVSVRPPASYVIAPKCRPFGTRPAGTPAIRITQVEALIDIQQTAATTTLDIHI